MKINNISSRQNISSSQAFEAIKVKGLSTSYAKSLVKTLTDDVLKNHSFQISENYLDSSNSTFSLLFPDLNVESRAINYLRARNIQITQKPHITLDNFDDFHNFD